MNILITNDDGILAPGLRALVEALMPLGTVRVVAPEREQSAAGHAITLHKPLRMDPVKLRGLPVEAYASNGTPADCVILGALTSDVRPDLVISGINRGANLGEEVLYSGTVSAAMEAAIQGLRAMAVSVCSYDTEDFSGAAQAAALLAPRVAELDLPDAFLNVNVPALPWEEIAGFAVAELGKRAYLNTVDRREDPRGRPYYWFTGEPQESENSEKTDIGAIARGRISLTPVHFDLTSYETLPRLLPLAVELSSANFPRK
ncbi:MAG TPA: 5'/3'-nucleotidase SurE [Armatimonadota bacterium]|jgi:5'-nucleotidase